MSGEAPRRRRRVAVVTGTRAEYGLLTSTLDAMERHPRLTPQLVVTGIHLLRAFGYTIQDIERDGRRIAGRIPMQKGDDDPLDQARGLARGIRGMAEFLEGAETDIVVVLGDRVEAMAGALAAVSTGRILAHIHGGDLAPGDFDEGFRHAITKLAHIHFPATRGARRRILQMGEQPERVFVVGAPGLDDILAVRKGVRRSAEPTGRAVVLFHPCGRAASRERRTMRVILRAVSAKGLSPTILYPNTDRGHSGIVSAIGEFAGKAGDGRVEVYRSLPREAFLRLLLASDVLVGNSSSGIIEAPALGVPSVNIGLRQEGRERGGASVIEAEETEESVGRGIRRALRRRPITSRTSVYGRGGSGKRIARILAETKLGDDLRRKVSEF